VQLLMILVSLFMFVYDVDGSNDGVRFVVCSKYGRGWGEMKNLTKILRTRFSRREILMEKYHSYFVQAHPKEVMGCMSSSL
jgi:hypothetical protein